MNKKLTRSGNRMLAGVCAGIAEYLDIDPTVVRVIFAAFTVFSCGTGFLIYLACMLIMPKSY